MKSLYIYLTFLVFATRKLEISALSEESQAFLDGHNSLRLKVAKGEVPGQPGAAEMKAMVWDDELFKKASDYIATFPQGHNPDKTVPSGRFTTGENLYWYSTPDRDYKVNPNDALESWFDENKDYKFGPIQMSDFTGPKSIGHYTQMVWSESIYLGCASSKNFDGQFNQIYVICNYGPAGNMLEEAPYKEGSSDKLIEAAAAA